ncbi:MAG: hypothetical protein EA357_01845 [Micavibrio sp.]|nr:MAG: hypothetical protein EA357_01845 [Micavibrio sp.]
MASQNKYKITLSLNILNHLGINLYSNVPSVLSEAVANAWDADATNVTVNINADDDIITVLDNGHGMTAEDLNDKFLHVGYKRRDNGEAITPRLQRKVMGRKGIGKLSLFSIADTVEVHSVKKGKKSGLIMRLPEIQKAIQNDASDMEKPGTYHPEPVEENKIAITEGTQITLKDLRKNIVRTAPYLRTRLARRFAVIGEKNQFTVSIDGVDISIEDRDYFKKLQYIWTFGSESENYKIQAVNQEKSDTFESSLEIAGETYNVSGWIGTFRNSGDARTADDESLNKISVIIRGKLAQENILDEFGDAGVYASYLIGEISADFLDSDDSEDIATSSRQSLIEHDPRYQELKRFVGKKLDHIRNKWTEWRNAEGEDKARQNPAIDAWFKELGVDSRRNAKSLFGKINQMKVDEEERTRLFSHAVIAFESLSYKDKLNDLENISIDNLSALSSIFTDFDDIEATWYHQITKGRINVIEALREKVSDNALEKVIQEYLFEHLWLLDPMWERATESPQMEITIKKAFDTVDAGLSQEEKDARLDIRYKTTSGSHIIIELKRPEISVTTIRLIEQVNKYKKALQKCLVAVEKQQEPIEIVCVLGKYPTDWDDPDNREMLKANKARIVLYGTLIEQAYQGYKHYLDKNEDKGRLMRLLENLEVGSL